MSLYKSAQYLAKLGFYVFPIIEGKKKPMIKDFTGSAVNVPEKTKRFWYDTLLDLEHYHNIGIATTKFKEGGLLVVDVDNKEEKNGSLEMEKLKKQGFDFPKTLTQKTPTGGYHLIYSCKEAVKQGADVLAIGLDIRSRGGYILGRGSVINGKKYLINNDPIVPAPQWLIDKCNEKEVDTRETKKSVKKIDQKGAKSRCKEYLLNSAPLAIEGQGGDQTTFRVANRLKDLGLTQKNALNLLLEHWNDRCEPSWDAEELEAKVANAYIYGQNAVGADSPENDFDAVEVPNKKETEVDVEGPIDRLNNEYSFIVLGGKSTIIQQKERGPISYMTPGAFHDLLAADTIQAGNGRRMQLSELWFNSPKRNTFSSVELIPGKQAPPGVFNLWRGFVCEPLGEDEIATKEMIEGVAMFKEHTLKNICDNKPELYNWLMGYFAHLIQKPWEKPLTALVFKGEKGVGKNALIELIGDLFNGHSMVASNKRYLMSNFNNHLANLVLFVLDEASWAGDKQAEGILKDLITGKNHNIEHKGREIFQVKNILRICILGNEEWVVPATGDERRFAVFNIGKGRQKDKAFFVKMKKFINKKGGNRLLLKELLDFDLSTMDVNDAPETQGLLDQKIESLSPMHDFWLTALKDGAMSDLDFSDNKWPENISRIQLRDAFTSYSRKRGIRSWIPNASSFGKELFKCCPGLENKRLRNEVGRPRGYSVPSLKECRAQFDKFIGHKIDWGEEIEEQLEPTEIDMLS